MVKAFTRFLFLTSILVFSPLVFSAQEDLGSLNDNQIPSGTRVWIHGLKSLLGKRLNGLSGQVISYNKKKKRYGVRFVIDDISNKSISYTNLSPIKSNWINQLTLLNLKRTYPKSTELQDSKEFDNLKLENIYEILTSFGFFDCGSALSTAVSYILSTWNPLLKKSLFSSVTISTSGCIDKNLLIRSLSRYKTHENQVKLTYLRFDIAYEMASLLPSTNAMGYWILLLEDGTCCYFSDNPSSFRVAHLEVLKEVLEMSFVSDLKEKKPELLQVYKLTKDFYLCQKKNIFIIDSRFDRYLPNLSKLSPKEQTEKLAYMLKSLGHHFRQGI
mgnify:CR=1 FL=1